MSGLSLNNLLKNSIWGAGLGTSDPFTDIPWLPDWQPRTDLTLSQMTQTAASSPWGYAPGPGPKISNTQLAGMIDQVANQYGIPPGLFRAMIKQESNFNMNDVSPAGAIGYTQLLPGTARELGVNPRDPYQNLVGGAKYLARQYSKYKDWRLALAAYNAGPGNVDKYRGIPPFKETQNHVRKVMNYWYGGV